MSELSDAQRAELKTRLETLGAQLRQQLSASDRTGTVELNPGAVGRVSRGDALQQQQMALAEQRRQRRRLRQVEAALKLDEEDLGLCRRCEEDIAWRRLEARPESPYCIACATELEQKRR